MPTKRRKSGLARALNLAPAQRHDLTGIEVVDDPRGESQDYEAFSFRGPGWTEGVRKDRSQMLPEYRALVNAYLRRKKRAKWPSIAHVAACLREVNEYDGDPYRSVGGLFDEGGIDVRLQVYPDWQWSVHSGSADYDQDHRGYWGSSSVPGSRRRFNANEVAKDLIEQAKDHHAQQ